MSEPNRAGTQSPAPPPCADAGAAVDVLWTGGWDSTYRVLDLVFNHGHPVQPHYVIAPVREGSPYEVAAMEAIREGVERRGRGALLAPVRQSSEDDLDPDPVSMRQIRQLRSQGRMGLQYEYLSGYARQRLGGRPLDLSIEKAVHPGAFDFLGGHVVPAPDSVGGGYTLPPDVEGPLGLFLPFRFPLLDLTKQDMEEAARQAGFVDLMALTWFCHTPHRGQPCGQCSPCRDVVTEGLGWRLSKRAHVRRLLLPAHRAVAGARRRLGAARRRATGAIGEAASPLG